MACRSKIALFVILSLFSFKPVFAEGNTILPENNIPKTQPVATPEPKKQEGVATNKGKAIADQITYEKNFKLIKLLGNAQVKINDGKDDITITSEVLYVDQDTNKVYTDKNFKIIDIREELDEKKNKKKKTTVINGKEFNFDLEIKRLTVKNASIETDAGVEGKKLYIKGDEITLYNKGDRISVVNGDVTTCELVEKEDHGHISLKAESFEIIPDVSIFAWSPMLKFQAQDIYWFPFVYLPLKKDSLSDIKTDTGKNDVEGNFANLKTPYKLNDYNEGNMFFRAMEKKWLGLGFEHFWAAYPTSTTYAYFYGNALNSDWFSLKDEISKQKTPLFFRDHEISFRHQQWLPFIPHNESIFTYNKKSFYNTNAITAFRDDKHDFEFKDTYEDIFEFSPEWKLNINPNYSVKRTGTNIVNNEKPYQIDSKNNDFTHNFSNTFSLENPILKKSNLAFSGSYKDSLGERLFNTSFLKDNALIEKFKNVDSYYYASDLKDLSLNPSLNLEILPNLTFNSSLLYNRNVNKTFNQPELPDSKSELTGSYLATQRITPSLTINQALDWGSINLSAGTSYDSWQEDLNPKDSSGNIIPDEKLTTEQKTKKTEALNKLKNDTSVTRLPEIKFTLNPFSKGISSGLTNFFNPILRDILPVDSYRNLIKNGENDWLFKDGIPLSTSLELGNYIENRRFHPDDKTGIKNVSKIGFDIGLASNQLDLGLGNKINFGQTGIKQRFYSTQDAQYSLSGNLNYTNDFFKFFIPTINYSRTIADKENNSPLSIDSTDLRNQHNINGGFNFFNTPELTLSTSGFGYDFENKLLNPSVNLNLDSKFEYGAFFAINANTSYSVDTVTEENIAGTRSQFIGSADLKKDIENTLLIDKDFKEKYAGYTKDQAKVDLDLLANKKITDKDFESKYSFDTRIKDKSTLKAYDDNLRYKKEDLYGINWKTNKFNNLNLTFAVSTPWEWESDNTDKYFGVYKTDIPWGIATQVRTNIDFAKADFYQDIKNDDKNLFKKNIDNLSSRFTNTTLDLIAVIGGDWKSHTKFKLSFGLIPPELLLDNAISTQKNRPVFPLDGNIAFSVKKDFHDFILYFDFSSNYATALDKTNWGFKFDLELTAFPNLLKDISKSIDSNKNQFDNLKNKTGIN